MYTWKSVETVMFLRIFQEKLLRGFLSLICDTGKIEKTVFANFVRVWRCRHGALFSAGTSQCRKQGRLFMKFME